MATSDGNSGDTEFRGHNTEFGASAEKQDRIHTTDTMPSQQVPTIPLFSYGTLQQENVQLATFGRLLEGRPDALAGFALAPIHITDPRVIAVSGAAIHHIARRTGDPADLVPGILFAITPAELAAADAYEVDYGRIEVSLTSGETAFVYADVDEAL
jgi:hypothetical protein